MASLFLMALILSVVFSVNDHKVKFVDMKKINPINVSSNMWEIPELTGINRERSHNVVAIPFCGKALTRDRANTPWFKSLNGEWKFIQKNPHQLQPILSAQISRILNG